MHKFNHTGRKHERNRSDRGCVMYVCVMCDVMCVQKTVATRILEFVLLGSHNSEAAKENNAVETSRSNFQRQQALAKNERHKTTHNEERLSITEWVA